MCGVEAVHRRRSPCTCSLNVTNHQISKREKRKKKKKVHYGSRHQFPAIGVLCRCHCHVVVVGGRHILPCRCAGGGSGVDVSQLTMMQCWCDMELLFTESYGRVYGPNPDLLDV